MPGVSIFPMSLPPAEETQRVHIYDHPESRIAFLESTLTGQQWRATLYPAALQGQDIAGMRSTLTAQGFHVEDGQDSHGNRTLEVLHLSGDSGLRENIRALGLAKGAEHTLSHMSAGKLFDTVKGGVNYVVSDKAHILSAFYILGDALLMFSGADNKSANGKVPFSEKLKTLRQPENALQSVSGICCAMNSLIMMVYAQEGNSRDYKQMKEQFYSAMIHGKDPTNPAEWEAPKVSNSWTSKVHRWLEDNPIEGGATAQIVSQVLIMGSGGMRWKKSAEALAMAHGAEREILKETVSGSKLDIGRGVMSILGWMGLIYPAHSVENKAPWHNPVRAVQEFQEHPERFASVLTGGASVVGMIGGKKKGNFSQYAGEASLVLGDVTIFFTDISEYGHGGKATLESVAQTAAKFIQESPALLDNAQQASFVDRLSQYLAGTMAARNPEVKPEDIAPQLSAQITEHLQKSPSRLEKVSEELASMLAALPVSQRENAGKELSQALAQLPGVYVAPEALQQSVSAALQTHAAPAADAAPPSMQGAASHLSTLVAEMPMLAIPQNMMRLYDTLTQYCATSPRDPIYLSHALKQGVQQNTGLSGPDLRQAERLAQAQSQPQRLH